MPVERLESLERQRRVRPRPGLIFAYRLLMRFFTLAAVSVGVRKLSQSRGNLGLFGKKTRSTGIGAVSASSFTASPTTFEFQRLPPAF